MALRDRRQHRGQVGTLVAGLGDVGAGELEEAAHEALEPLGVGGEVLEKAVALLRRHGRRVVAQQLHRALDRRERRLELVRDLRGEGADVVGALLQGARHGGHGLREPADLPRDRPGERRHRALLAARRAFALADHRLEGTADGARGEERHQDDDGEEHAGAGEEVEAVVVEGLADAARRARQHDRPDHPAPVEDRQRDEHPHARPPAERGEGRARSLGDALAEHAHRLAAERARDLLALGEGAAELLAGRGDDHAPEVGHADARQGDRLRVLHHRHELAAGRDAGRVGRRRALGRRGRPRAHAVERQVERRRARLPAPLGGQPLGCRGHAVVGRARRIGARPAERRPVRRGEDGRLPEQLGLGLAHERALVEAEHRHAAERQREDHQVRSTAPARRSARTPSTTSTCGERPLRRCLALIGHPTRFEIEGRPRVRGARAPDAQDRRVCARSARP